jgi:hypothetical protein
MKKYYSVLFWAADETWREVQSHIQGFIAIKLQRWNVIYRASVTADCAVSVPPPIAVAS